MAMTPVGTPAVAPPSLLVSTLGVPDGELVGDDDGA
jgi:hypothetical protein